MGSRIAVVVELILVQYRRWSDGRTEALRVTLGNPRLSKTIDVARWQNGVQMPEPSRVVAVLRTNPREV